MSEQTVERTRVVSGVVIKNGLILLAQRDPERSDFGLFWETPGGKVEVGEMARTALEREFQEELGVTIEPGEHLATFTFDPPVCRYPVKVALYRAEILEEYGALEAREVIGFGWYTLDGALAQPLTPSTKAYLETLRALGKGFPE